MLFKKRITEVDPIMLVISRAQVESGDTSEPLAVLQQLISSPEMIRQSRERLDVAFDGYNHQREELFEIPEVRNYVYALDAEFPYWLYFMTRESPGLQCLALCFLPPYLTPEARQEIHARRLDELIEKRWGPALDQVCQAASLSDSEVESLVKSAVNYFLSGPTPQEARSEVSGHTASLFADEEQNSDFFAGVRPARIYHHWAMPDSQKPRTAMAAENFPFFHDYFDENGMSFHCSNHEADLVLFFSVAPKECPTILKAPWGMSWEQTNPHTLIVNLLIFDQPEDPLITPFIFNFKCPEMAAQNIYDAVRLVEQETISVSILARQGDALAFFDSKCLQVPDDVRADLAVAIRQMFFDAQASP